MAKSIYKILIELEGAKQATDAINQVGVQLGLTGAALTAFAGATAKMAADYETILSNVATVSTEATGSTEEFSQALFRLQGEMNGALDVQKAAQTSYDLLSSGITDQAAVLSALENSQKAAISGQGDMNEIAKAATSVVNTYGEALGVGSDKAAQFDKAINLILQTQLDGVITAGEYANSVGRVVSSFKGAGISLEEFNAMIALTTAKGIPAASSFTNLQQAISNIQRPTKMAQDEAKELGISFDAARLQAVGMEGILKDLANSPLKPDSLTKLFESTEARNSIQALVQNIDQLDFYMERQVNGTEALSKAYAQFEDDVNLRVTSAINQMKGAFIQMGQGVLEVSAPVIEFLGNLAQTISELDPNILKAVGAFAALLGVTLTVAGGIALLITGLGTVITNYLALTGAIGAATLAMKTYAATLAMTSTNLTTFQAASILLNKSLAGAIPALKGMMSSLVAMGPLLAVVAASVGAVYVAYQTWDGIVGPARAAKQATEDLNESLKEYERLRGGTGKTQIGVQVETGENLKNLEDSLNRVQKASDFVITKIQGLQGVLSNLTPDVVKAALEFTNIGAVFGFLPPIATNLEASTNKVNQAFNGLLEISSKASLGAAQLITDLKEGEQIDPAAIEAMVAQLDQSITSLKESNVTTEDGIAARDGMVATLERQKAALTQTNQATDENKDVTDGAKDTTEDNQKTVEEAAKAYQEYAQKIRDANSNLQAQADLNKAQVTGSNTEQAIKSLQIQEESTASQIALLEDLKNQSQTTAQERVAIEIEIAQKTLSLQEERIATQEQLEQAHNEWLKANQSIRTSELETRLATENLGYKEAYALKTQIATENYNLEKQLLLDKINDEAEHSSERQVLVAELAELEQGFATETHNLLKEFNQAELQDHQEKIQLKMEENRAYFEDLQGQLEISQAFQDINLSYLDTQSGLISKISGLLEGDNATLGQRAELIGLAERLTGESLRNSQGNYDVDIAREAIQKTLNQLEIQKIDLKIRQLELDKESLAIANEIRQLEIQSQREKIQSQLQDQNLNENQRRSLQNQDASLGRQAELENRKTEVATRGINDQINFAGIERDIAQAMSRNTRDQSVSGVYGDPSGRSARVSDFDRLASRGDLSQSEVNRMYGDGSIGAQEWRKLTDSIEAQREQAAKDSERRQKESERQEKAQERASRSSETNARVTEEGFREVATDTRAIRQVSSSLGDLVRVSTSLLRVNERMATKLDSISNQIGRLPNDIASRLPRPSSPPPARR